MTTHIHYAGPSTVIVMCDDLHMTYICDSTDFNKYHNGIWNSRTMSFVPKLPDTFMVGNYDDDYEQWAADCLKQDLAGLNQPYYTDNSGIYYERCIVCSVETLGNKYCGASCEQQDTEALYDTFLR